MCTVAISDNVPISSARAFFLFFHWQLQFDGFYCMCMSEICLYIKDCYRKQYIMDEKGVCKTARGNQGKSICLNMGDAHEQIELTILLPIVAPAPKMIESHSLLKKLEANRLPLPLDFCCCCGCCCGM